MTEKIIYYIFTFFFFSAIGWTVESTYRSLGERKVINSGFLHGPVCPIYGTGALVFEVLLVPHSLPFQQRWWVVLLAGVIAADTVEYVTSYLMEKLFHARWWDYTGNFLNINGRICFRHSCYWAIAAGVYCYLISPLYAFFQSLIPANIKSVAVGVILTVFAFDLFLTVKAAINVQNIMKKLESIRDILTLGAEYIRAGSEIMLDTAEDKVDGLKQSAEERMEEIKHSAEENYEELKKIIASFRSDEKAGYERETKRLFVSYAALRDKVIRTMGQIERVIEGKTDDDGEDAAPEDAPENRNETDENVRTEEK